MFTAATVGNMACGGVKSSEAGKISCEAYQSKMKINVNLLNFAFCSIAYKSLLAYNKYL